MTFNLTEQKFAKMFAKAFHEVVVPALKDMEERLANKKDTEKHFDKIEEDLFEIKHELSDLRYDTPTMKEFNDLKHKVDSHLAGHVE